MINPLIRFHVRGFDLWNPNRECLTCDKRGPDLAHQVYESVVSLIADILHDRVYAAIEAHEIEHGCRPNEYPHSAALLHACVEASALLDLLPLGLYPVLIG